MSHLLSLTEEARCKYPVVRPNVELFVNRSGGYLIKSQVTTVTDASGGLVTLTGLQRDLLSQCDGTHTLQEIYVQLKTEHPGLMLYDVFSNIEHLIWMKTLEFHDDRRKSDILMFGKKSMYLPMHVVVEPTSRCNLRCSHCYRGSGPEGGAMLPIDSIIPKLMTLAQMGAKIVEITGGEPLLHPDILKLVRFCCEDPNLRIIALLTNGNLVDEEFVGNIRPYLKSRRLTVSVTLDSSTPEFHDNVRQSAGSWQRTVRAIKLFANEGTLLRVVMNVFPGNKDDVEDNLLFTKGLGASVFSPSPVQPLGRGADVGWDKVSKDGMRKYRLKWGELVKKHKGFMLLSQPRVIREMQRGINCGHGHRSWVIGPSGDVRPCVMMPEGLISLGNILREEIENIASNPFLGNLFSVKPPGSYSTCDFCKYNVFCPFCLYRAICAGQENDECELWRDPMLAAHVNTSYLGRYSCSMAYTMFQR